MKTIENIIEEAKKNNWPYPKTHAMLKKIGVKGYEANFEGTYTVKFFGDFGSWESTPAEPSGNLKISEAFCKDGVKKAVEVHAQGKTSYPQLLEDLSACGISHYKVNMDKHEIRYYNPQETESHLEMIPEWNG